jgi:glutamate synthase (NADPH/NADH) large chain
MYLSGCVAERFCVRNSGLIAVVEGVGDHGCEYMTGGRAVILGEVGRNFGAGMSGGIAYVYNPNLTLQNQANASMIDFDPMDAESQKELLDLLTKHAELTGSPIAKQILGDWNAELAHFVKVMPKALKEALAAQNKQLLQAS